MAQKLLVSNAMWDVDQGFGMPTLTIKHITTYQYRHPVAFGEHRMMLRPRDGHDQSLIDARLVITPTPISICRTRDAFANHLDIARFADRAKELYTLPYSSSISRAAVAGTRFDAVLAAVKDAARRLRRWPKRAILDRGCARRPHAQAGRDEETALRIAVDTVIGVKGI